jgi:parallel beta-helix repeat protein
MTIFRACVLFGATLSLMLAAAPAKSYAAPGARFFVSTTGNDHNPGTLEQPFATLECARDAIRDLKRKSSLPDGGAVVLVRGGTYSLSKTFALDDRDSGSAKSPVVYRAYQNEAVHLIGGERLNGFSPVKDPGILKSLDAAARGKVLQIDLKAAGIFDFGELKRRGFGAWGVPAALELFFEGKPMTLARWPNGAWAKTAAAAPAGPNGDRFSYEGDRPSRWSKADDLWLHGYWSWDWADMYVRVASINPLSREIVTHGSPVEFGYKAGARFYALNLLEELDQPGEWYLDRNSGVLYFWPPAPLKPGSAAVSLLPTIVSLNNASYLTIRGMTIEICRGTAVTLRGGRNSRIAGCTIRNAGNAAVSIEGGTGNGVQGSDIYQCGEGGVVLSGGDRRTLTAGGNYCLNNSIHDFGQWSRTYTPGISLSGVGNRIAHNLIYNAPHSAILLHGNEHVIEYNEIHHVCLETSDAGAFYMGRDYTERGNLVRFNYFHHLNLGDVQAIYLDDFASGTTIYGNVVFQAGRGVLVGGGRDNKVQNNIFIDCQQPTYLDARGTDQFRKYFDGTDTALTDRLKAVNYRNPPYSTRYPELLRLYDKNPALPEGNSFVGNISVGGPWLELKDGLTEATVKMAGNHVGGDPGFVDRARNNFQLKVDSPVLRKGFKRIPMGRIGLYKDEFRK